MVLDQKSIKNKVWYGESRPTKQSDRGIFIMYLVF